MNGQLSYSVSNVFMLLKKKIAKSRLDNIGWDALYANSQIKFRGKDSLQTRCIYYIHVKAAIGKIA